MLRTKKTTIVFCARSSPKKVTLTKNITILLHLLCPLIINHSIATAHTWLRGTAMALFQVVLLRKFLPPHPCIVTKYFAVGTAALTLCYCCVTVVLL